MSDRNSGGIKGKGGKNVNPVYKDSGGHVKVIAAGTKPLTRPNKPYHIGALRSPDQLKRMGGAGISGAFGIKNK